MRARVWAALLAAVAAPFVAGNGEAQAVVQAPPLLHAYLDTASLHTALAKLPASRSEKRTGRLFRIEFDSAGQPLAPVAAVPRAMPARYRDAVAPLIHASLRPIAPRSGGWLAFIAVEAGDSPRVEEIYPVEQQPSVANLGAVREALYRSTQQIFRADSTLAGREVVVRIEINVSEDGVASAPRVVAPSGIAAVDQAALRVMAMIRFRPALLEGEPVSSRIVLPFTFVFSADG